ncbi:DUF2336 domain-containing protein [Roseococcus sp. YIM B11640]|uniref:DUF2336 domain-containing protein n=1 Tax=Roseococcus sp. YIM B11640 TaxID=3133973 RepID=UPI003C7A6FA1
MAPLDSPSSDKAIAFNGDLSERMDLAARPGAPPEILVFLATDRAEAVRRKVAENPGAPSHADRLLAQDRVDDIRARLARKLAARADQLVEDLQDRRSRIGWEALLLLAQDPEVEVRHAVADTLADLAHPPHDLALALARDAAPSVCEPVIRICAALTEGDLLEIVRLPPGEASRMAVARRLGLPAPVCDALAQSQDVPALEAMLRNPTARIGEDTFPLLLDLARRHQGLQGCLARRPGLPARAAAVLALFLSEDMLQWLKGLEEPPAHVTWLLRARAMTEDRSDSMRYEFVWPTS